MSNAKEDPFEDGGALPYVYILKYFKNDCPFCNICLIKIFVTLSVIDWYTRNCFFYIVSSYFMSTQYSGKHTNKARKLEKGVSIISG